MKLRGAVVLLAVVPLSALAQDPFSQSDPFEQRFKAKPNFQIKFHAPEKGGEVRLAARGGAQRLDVVVFAFEVGARESGLSCIPVFQANAMKVG